MLETIVLLYGISLVAGSWLMLKGVVEAPLGYEDEHGFHPETVPATQQEGHLAPELTEVVGER